MPRKRKPFNRRLTGVRNGTTCRITRIEGKGILKRTKQKGLYIGTIIKVKENLNSITGAPMIVNIKVTDRDWAEDTISRSVAHSIFVEELR